MSSMRPGPASLLMPLVLVACSSALPPGTGGAREVAPPPPRPVQGQPDASPLFAWQCEDDARPVTRYDSASGDLILRLDGRLHVLRPTRTESGAAWEADGVRFWNQGEEAIFTGPQRDTVCRVDRPWTLERRADDAGAVFRGVGNEPGWSVEVHPDRIELASDYGTTRRTYAAPRREIDGEMTVWSAGSGAEGIRVEVGPGPCIDAAGRSLPSKVTVIHGERRLPGCGRRLGDLP